MNNKILFASVAILAAVSASANQLKFFRALSWEKAHTAPFVFSEDVRPAARNQMVRFDSILSRCGLKLVYVRANDGRNVEMNGIASFKLDDTFWNGKVAIHASSQTRTLCPNGINITIGDEEASVRWK
ncbi:MAG: hypothetical protein FWD33_00460 [Alphaproteobacteria bacterium]|nr:hypothetical protein [Alphaproteobacteria bacterium]